MNFSPLQRTSFSKYSLSCLLWNFFMLHHVNVASKNLHQVCNDTALLEESYFGWKIEKYVEVGMYRVLAPSDRTEYLDIRRTKAFE